jgi:porin
MTDARISLSARWGYGLATIVTLSAAAVPLSAQQQDTTGSLAGPNQVDNQLRTDAAPKEPLVRLTFLAPWFDFKETLKENSGLGFGVDYSTVLLTSNSEIGEGKASSGMVRLFGSWQLIGGESANTGSLVFKIEHRHAYGAIAPSGLSFDVGYAGITAAPFSDQGLRLTNLYWRQTLGDGRFVLLGGFLDATDFVDVYGLASPWLHFSNLVFSTGVSAIALPNDALLGVAVGAWLSDQVYTIAHLGDNGADPTKPFTGFDRFVNDNEYFTSIELGWTPSRARAYFDNVHVTAWHSDEKSETGDPSGWGVNVSGTIYLNEKVMPFLRAGYAKDGGSLLQKSVSAGLGYQAVQGRDLFGFGVNWGQPNATTWGEGLDDQISFELFWRWFLGEQLALTPDLQYLINPAVNPDEDSVWMFGVRGRLAM